MKVDLICSDNMKSVLAEILKNREIEMDGNATTVIVEMGFDYPKDKIVIMFDSKTLSYLLNLLDNLVIKQENPFVLSGKSDDGFDILSYSDVSYFEGLGNDVFCIVKNNKYKIKEKLYELEERLKNDGFIRVSKSFIVNIKKVKQIQPWFNGKLILKMEETSVDLDVTRKYAKSFKEFLNM